VKESIPMVRNWRPYISAAQDCRFDDGKKALAALAGK
jgi:hypothetical protein